MPGKGGSSISAFGDARALVAHCDERLAVINGLYEECVRDQSLKASVCIETGKPYHGPYFPYAQTKDTEAAFRNRAIFLPKGKQEAMRREAMLAQCFGYDAGNFLVQQIDHDLTFDTGAY
jgi:hypothetical protein